MKKIIAPVAAPMPVPSAPAAPVPPAPRSVQAPPPVPQPSPMARPPVAPTSRKVPSVQTGRGVVRTDTHNQANQIPHHAKHKGRGL